jgi:hypothetical protein
VTSILARLVVLSLPITLLAYTPLALAHHWWISGLSAPLVAWLLWRRHPRARFSAYVLLSIVVIRSTLRGPAWLALVAIAGVVVMQTPHAIAAWPRLRLGKRPGARDGDRMTPP